MTKKDTRRDAWNFDYVGMKSIHLTKRKEIPRLGIYGR
tara:strand:+ start:197 stop:310 length:114 start_codon:yes stop_codon:yes gene_type:complete